MILSIFILLGVSVINIAILGFIVYSANTKSVTNKAFLFIALASVLFGIFNFLYHQPNLNNLALWFLRIHMFFAVWYAFLIFYLYYVFPKESVSYSKFFKFFLVPWIVFVSILTLTPLVFERIISFKPDGTIGEVKTNFGIALFGITVISFLVSFFVGFIKKIYQTKDKLLRFQYILIFLGAFITFGLHIYFNFVLPNFYNNTKYTNLAALYSFPFILFTALAILRYRLLGARVILTDLFILILLVLSAIQILSAISSIEIILRLVIFILVLIFGISTIRSIRREVFHREELESLNKKLQLAYEEVDRLSKAKSEFISIASHQLRTPLTAIKGYISMLIEGTYGVLPKNAKKPLENVYESNERLINLVNNLLDISRIEAGRMELEPEEAQIEDIIESVVRELKITADQKKLYLKYDKPVQLLSKLLLDKDKIRQVFLNLINNSIKYTNQGGITIKIKNQTDIKNTILITISDTGEGMTKEDLAKIFESFSRGSVGVQLSAEGAGLGLYIARKFVEMHNGKIWAESEGKGKGSTFFIELPIKPVKLNFRME